MKRSNVLSKLLTAYLLGSGTKRRVIDVLHGLGITYSYMGGKRMLDSISIEARRYA